MVMIIPNTVEHKKGKYTFVLEIYTPGQLEKYKIDS